MSATAQKSTAPDRDRLLAEIRGAGLRATASRVAVLRVLHEERRPMSHSELIQALKEHTWDPSTLYRNLTDLAEVGLLRRSEFGDRTWRFEVACHHGHGEYAAHFLCRDCGDIACLPELTVKPSGEETMPMAVLSGSVEVQILGQCDSCFTPAAE